MFTCWQKSLKVCRLLATQLQTRAKKVVFFRIWGQGLQFFDLSTLIQFSYNHTQTLAQKNTDYATLQAVFSQNQAAYAGLVQIPHNSASRVKLGWANAKTAPTDKRTHSNLAHTLV